MIFTRCLMLLNYAAGAYRTMKCLKHTGHDFGILVYWTVVATVELYTCYLEGLFSWVPLYFHAKGVFLIVMLIPRLPIPRIVFHTIIIPSMTLMNEMCQDKSFFEIIVLELPKQALHLILPSLNNPHSKTPSDQPVEDLDAGDNRDCAVPRKEPVLRSRGSPVKVPDTKVKKHRSTATATIKNRKPIPPKSTSVKMARRILTGDENVSLRSHLFDLEVPSYPVRRLSHESPKSSPVSSRPSKRLSPSKFGAGKKSSVRSSVESIEKRKRAVEALTTKGPRPEPLRRQSSRLSKSNESTTREKPQTSSKKTPALSSSRFDTRKTTEKGTSPKIESVSSNRVRTIPRTRQSTSKTDPAVPAKKTAAVPKTVVKKKPLSNRKRLDGSVFTSSVKSIEEKKIEPSNTKRVGRRSSALAESKSTEEKKTEPSNTKKVGRRRLPISKSREAFK